MSAHPKRHVREDHGGQQIGDGLEDRLGARTVVLLDGVVRDHATRAGEHEGRCHAEVDITEILPLAGAIEIREQDRDDHAGFHAFAQEDHQRRDHEHPPRLCASG
jgi:hypothetical protein